MAGAKESSGMHVPTYLSPDARLKLCELIAEEIRGQNLKLYATLAEAGLKGPAFYAYLENRSTPSDEVVPRIISLAMALNRERALEIVRGELEDLSEFVDELMGFAEASVSSVGEILSAITGAGRPRKRSRK